MNRHTNQHVWASQAPDLDNTEAALAEMHAIGSERHRDIDPVVHDDRGIAGCGVTLDCLHEIGNFPSAEVRISNLHGIDASLDRQPYRRHDLNRIDGLVRDQMKTPNTTHHAENPRRALPGRTCIGGCNGSESQWFWSAPSSAGTARIRF
jgi:hypothetical protein